MTEVRTHRRGLAERTGPFAAGGQAGFTLAELLAVTVIIAITMGITTGALVSTQRNYGAQRERLETAHGARAAADMISRLIRMSGNNPYSIAMTGIGADPDNNNTWDSVRIQGDWNPADGDITDRYENITFTVANGQLFKQEPDWDNGDPVLFADSVASIAFTYRDTNNNAIANPVASAGAIAYATMVLTTRSTALVQDGPPLTLTTSVAVRRRE